MIFSRLGTQPRVLHDLQEARGIQCTSVQPYISTFPIRQMLGRCIYMHRRCERPEMLQVLQLSIMGYLQHADPAWGEVHDLGTISLIKSQSKIFKRVHLRLPMYKDISPTSFLSEEACIQLWELVLILYRNQEAYHWRTWCWWRYGEWMILRSIVTRSLEAL